MGDPSHAKAVKAVDAIFERYHAIAADQGFTGFDKHTMENLKLIDATSTPRATVTYHLLIDEHYGNLNSVMHGGAAGVIFDMCTTTALGPLSRPGYWDFLAGVTRKLDISYLRAIPIGTTIQLYSEVIQVGRTMALVRGTMSSLDGKTVFCTAEHHKVRVPTRPEHNRYRIPWDDLWDENGEEVEAGLKKASKL